MILWLEQLLSERAMANKKIKNVRFTPMQKSMSQVQYLKVGCLFVVLSSTRAVRNQAVLRELRHLRVGRWKKVIKQGNFGEVHYFEHESGSIASVKFFSKMEKT